MVKIKVSPVFSNEEFKKVERWMYNNARPMEIALWRYHFEGADNKEALSVLTRYQNDDGGFGNGLDPDNWNPFSSPSVTNFACNIMEQIKCTADDEIVKKTLSYLDNAERFSNNFWCTYLPSNNTYPHAPWWTWHGSYFDGLEYNPTIELCSFALKYADVNSQLYNTTTKTVDFIINNYLNSTVSLGFTYYISLTKLLRFIIESKVESNRFSRCLPLFEEKLSSEVNSIILEYKDQWDENFIALPIYFIKSTNDYLYDTCSELIFENFTWLKDSINFEGVWNITWCWSHYLKEFYISENWWKSIIALERMNILKTFDMIDL